MLYELSVKNFAIIEDLTVDFGPGMTVLTGETGAGKSLIIDTISLLLGSRADSDMIRYNEKYASITGVFSCDNSLNEYLDRYNIPRQDRITIHREIYDNSRNVLKINGASVTLVTLKQISQHLADLHIQNDTYKLFNPDDYLEFIDDHNDPRLDKLLTAYSKALYDYNSEYKTYEKILKGQKATLDRLEFIKYEHDELEELGLYPGIDTELEEKIAKLSNYDKIFQGLNEGYMSLDNGAIDSLYEAARALDGIVGLSKEYADYKERLMDSYYICQEIHDSISKDISSLDYDEDELNSYIDTLNEINKCKDKYKRNVDELISYLKELSIEIEMVTNYDEVLKDSYNSLEKAYNNLKDKSIALSNYRKGLAKRLEGFIEGECKDLDLLNTTFRIEFNEVSYNDPLDRSPFMENGSDKPAFLISFNKGEPLKMLHKVASGGEMSRIMLAFKAHIAKMGKVGLMVFDEIDTGVSGTTAKKIAVKMHEISKNTQVLCITHLPQVAAIGDIHKRIYKEEENNRTFTRIKELDFDSRVMEIATMLSGDALSVYALEHAKELITGK